MMMRAWLCISNCTSLSIVFTDIGSVIWQISLRKLHYHCTILASSWYVEYGCIFYIQFCSQIIFPVRLAIYNFTLN